MKKKPAFLRQSTNSIVIGEGVQPIDGIKITEQDGKLTIFYEKSLKQKTTLILTSDIPAQKVEVRFRRNTMNAVNLIHHFHKNTAYDTRVFLEPGSNVRLIESFLTTGPVKSTMNRSFVLEEASLLTLSAGLFLCGGHTFTEEILLQGIGAEIAYDTLSIGSKSDKVTVAQNIRHQAKKTVSMVRNLMVSNMASSIEYYVSGYIAKGMSGSDCKQQNRGVILTDLGAVRVDPKLYIDEYDVEAGHGAAIGQINEDEMFYLLSRGLSEDDAKRLILSGYTEPFLSSLDEGVLKDAISRKIKRKVKGVES